MDVSSESKCVFQYTIYKLVTLTLRPAANWFCNPKMSRFIDIVYFAHDWLKLARIRQFSVITSAEPMDRLLTAV